MTILFFFFSKSVLVTARMKLDSQPCVMIAWVKRQRKLRVLYIVTLANGVFCDGGTCSPLSFSTGQTINETYGHKSNLTIFWIAWDWYLREEVHINISRKDGWGQSWNRKGMALWILWRLHFCMLSSPQRSAILLRARPPTLCTVVLSWHITNTLWTSFPFL